MITTNRFSMPGGPDAEILTNAEALHIVCHRSVEGVLGVTWQIHGHILESDGSPDDDPAALARRLFARFTQPEQTEVHE
jgi:hypothetical protein